MLRFPSRALRQQNVINVGSSFCCFPFARYFSMMRSNSSSSALPQSVAAELKEVALTELHNEIQRDTEENASANIPLPPPGWTVSHTSGSCVFKMSSLQRFSSFGNANNSRKTTKTSWSARIELQARFESVDPSFWDPDVSVCEYVPFRVYIQRVAPIFPSTATTTTTMSTSTTHQNIIHSSMLVADCASVQSQLRIRRLFFAPCSDKSALEDEAATGYPHGVFAGTFSWIKVSNELKQSTMEWLSSCGVDNRLAEFVCQMGYYYEHEEYQLWLARLANFAGNSEVAEKGSNSIHEAAREIAKQQYALKQSGSTFSAAAANRMGAVLKRVEDSQVRHSFKGDTNAASSGTSSITGKRRQERFTRGK